MLHTCFTVNPQSIRTWSQMHRTDKYSQYSSIIWPAWLNGWVLIYKLSGSAVTKTSDIPLVSSNKFLGIQVTIECGFTLKRICDIIRTYSQIHCTDKHFQHSSIIWPVSLNGWVFAYELSGCGFKFRCSNLDFRYRACFEKGLLHIQATIECRYPSETRTWHDKNKHSNTPYRLVLTAQLDYLATLAKWLSARLQTKWLWIWVPLQSLKLQLLRLLWARNSWTFMRL